MEYLNLSLWIDRRRKDVGPYADYIIKGVAEYEAEIARLTARVAELGAAPNITPQPDAELDTLVKKLRQYGRAAKNPSIVADYSEGLALEAADAITALRDRENAMVAAAFEAAAVRCEMVPEDTLVNADQRLVFDPVAARIRDLTPADATAALDRMLLAERNKVRREMADILCLNAWAHQGTDAYSQGMDAGARHQNKVDVAAILTTIEPEEGK